MRGWQRYLRGDTKAWLLEEENPSVRYFTLRDILDRSGNDPEVKEAEGQIMESGIVPKILARQNPGGYWESPESFYVRTKYRGTVWQLIILASLRADPQDPRVQRACDFILEWSQDRKSGGFSYRGTQQNGGQHSGVIPCLSGNMVWSLIRLGRLEDPKVQEGIQWITTYQRCDDGVDTAPKEWPYEKFTQCWGRHTCHLGVVKALKAFAEIPPPQRNTEVRRFIHEGAEYLLKHHLFKRSHDLRRVAKPKWKRLGFPHMWDTDVLEMTDILLRLSYHDPRMQDAIEHILSKQDEQGRWLMEETWNGRFQVNIEHKGKPSKWVTMMALRALKAYHA